MLFRIFSRFLAENSETYQALKFDSICWRLFLLNMVEELLKKHKSTRKHDRMLNSHLSSFLLIPI